jgi:diguanylate cyclase (GGDEF)-like protein
VPVRRVLLVGADSTARAGARQELEAAGATVVEAGTLAEARDKLDDSLDTVVLAHRLPDGGAGDLLPSIATFAPRAAVVIEGGGRRPDPEPELSVAELMSDELDDLGKDWAEHCRWDPVLPPEAPPPVAPALVQAVAAALARPQPLAFGPDPEVEEAVEAFADRSESLEVLIEQLVCLGEVFRRRTTGRVPSGELPETFARLQMLVDRAIGVAARSASARLVEEASADALTGLRNRRAFSRDLERERRRAARYGREFSVVVIDLDGLKVINDTLGHLEGDRRLLGLADALREGLRATDAAYRIGGDEFVLLLPETAGPDATVLLGRLASREGTPAFSWGVATFPGDLRDGDDIAMLVERADQRLLTSRRRNRRTPARTAPA